MLNASGTVTKTYDYDAYGNELTRDLNDSNPFRYCGEYYDTETGFIYLRARYYDPTIGRFISQDPHWNVGNMIYGDNPSKKLHPDINAIIQSGNSYVYCMNSPVTYKDPLGEWIWPGQVHQKVLNTIYSLFKETYELYKEQGIALSNGGRGRADLIMKTGDTSGLVWELKRIRKNDPHGWISEFYRRQANTQLDNYVSGTWINDSEVKLQRGGDMAFLKGTTTIQYGGITYIVSYFYDGNGIFGYDYERDPNTRQRVDENPATAIDSHENKAKIDKKNNITVTKNSGNDAIAAIAVIGTAAFVVGAIRLATRGLGSRADSLSLA